MAGASAIEWTERTWNPIKGCKVLSPGCTNCYAMRLAGTRLKAHPSYAGLTVDTKAGPVWTGEMRLDEKALLEPLGWRTPRVIFVNSMSDLFAEGVPDEWIDKIYAVMALTPHHTYQVLTKRAARMRTYFAGIPELPNEPAIRGAVIEGEAQALWSARNGGADPSLWLAVHMPLPNVWHGVSAEDQGRADERIPELLRTPSAIRFVSAEPLLAWIDMKRWLPAGRQARRPGGESFIAPQFFMTSCEHCGWIGSSELCEKDWGGDDSDVYCPACLRSIRADDEPHLDLVICGGERGPNARPMPPEAPRRLRDQCAGSSDGTKFFFKQWGEFGPTSDANGKYMARFGYKVTGRHLDGRLHDDMPEIGP
jgi:protein gp37